MGLLLEGPIRQEVARRRRQTSDKRVAQRLFALLWVDDGRPQREAAELLGVTPRQVRKWLRRYRTRGLDAVCTLQYQGGHGRASASPRSSDSRRRSPQAAFSALSRPATGLVMCSRRPTRRGGCATCCTASASVTTRRRGFFWKANPARQEKFLHTHVRQKRQADGRETRRYFVDACHPVWGVEMLYSCWLLVGQRFLVGVGGGRKRLNILGAYCPDDQEYLDVRLTKDNINGQQFVNLLRLLRASLILFNVIPLFRPGSSSTFYGCCGPAVPRPPRSSCTWTTPATTTPQW